MSFVTEEFLIFLITFLAAYWIAPNARYQNAFTLAASLLFYSWWDWRFLALIMASIAMNYCVGRAVGSSRPILFIGVASNLGLLAVFKYFDFFLSEAMVLIQHVGLAVETQTLGIILPVGISFFTFQGISYIVDVHRGRVESERDAIKFACYISLFPQLVAGPIVRASKLLPQLSKVRRFSWPLIFLGAEKVTFGLFLKLVVADRLAPLVDRAFSSPEALPSISLLIGSFLFSIQIYADFAGYSLIAIGIASIMGLRFARNFNRPYMALSPSDFWRRWHISLSSFLRDYLYIPIGGNRKQGTRNLFVTMALGGLWHGAGWTFLVWGLLHGIYLAVAKTISSKFRSRLATRIVLITCVSFAWIFFRSDDFGTALIMIQGILSFQFVAPTGLGGSIALGMALCFALSLLIFEWACEETKCGHLVRKREMRLFGVIGAAWMISFMGMIGGDGFVYFQF